MRWRRRGRRKGMMARPRVGCRRILRGARGAGWTASETAPRRDHDSSPCWDSLVLSHEDHSAHCRKSVHTTNPGPPAGCNPWLSWRPKSHQHVDGEGLPPARKLGKTAPCTNSEVCHLLGARRTLSPMCRGRKEARRVWPWVTDPRSPELHCEACAFS